MKPKREAAPTCCSGSRNPGRRRDRQADPGTTPASSDEAPGRDAAQPDPSGWWCVRQEPTEAPTRDKGPSRTVVLSDVHIGTNARTCWYQRAVHEPYLASVLDYVIAHADVADQPVSELVILGDLFDFSDVSARAATADDRGHRRCEPRDPRV